MILGFGIDLVSIKRIEGLFDKFGQKFTGKIFTKHEIDFAANLNKDRQLEYFAKRFAVKEAFSKASGLGIGRGIDFIDVETINDKNGKPEVKLTSKAKLFLEKYFGTEDIMINVSIADEVDLAIASVIISKR